MQWPQSLLDILREPIQARVLNGGEVYHKAGMITEWRTFPSLLIATMLEGSFRMSLPNGRYFDIERGGYLIVPPNLKHTMQNLNGQPSLDRFLFLQYRILGVIDVFSIVRPHYIYDPSQSVSFAGIVENLARPGTAPSPSLITARQASALQLLSCLLEDSRPIDDAVERTLSILRLMPVLRYIEDNLQHTLSRAKLASIVGLSESRFHHVFKAAISSAPLEYVKQRRLEEARTLLLAGDMTVEEIALAVGYADPFHFSRLFKSAFGLSPMHYRKQRPQAID